MDRSSASTGTNQRPLSAEQIRQAAITAAAATYYPGIDAQTDYLPEGSLIQPRPTTAYVQRPPYQDNYQLYTSCALVRLPAQVYPRPGPGREPSPTPPQLAPPTQPSYVPPPPTGLWLLADPPTPNSHPGYSVKVLMEYAIKGSPTGRMSLNDIYEAVEMRFPIMTTDIGANWR